ncbi:MAG: DNA polymerase IV [Thermoplasmata archaeon]|nr:DNA polymerase IV [Thermoplasmata archaeon]
MRFCLYVDMDAYYVSCELRDRPELLGRPVIVGPDPKLGPTRGVVLSASYEARAFGIRSALPVAQADRLCPEAVWIPAHFPLYESTAREVRALLAAFGDRVVPLSIDEAAVETELPDAAAAGARAREVQAALRTELRLPASIGVSPFRTVAKIASDRAKPAGVVVVPAEATASFLAPLGIRSVPGVGPKTTERLQAIGVAHIADVLTVSPARLRETVGSFAGELVALARGAPVEGTSRDAAGPRTRSAAETFVADVADLPTLLLAIDRLSADLAAAVAAEGLGFQTVTVAVRWEDFTRGQKSQTLSGVRRDAASLRATARRLLRLLWEREATRGHRRARTVSVSTERLRELRAGGPDLESFAPSGAHG